MESALSDGAFDPGLRLIETMLWDGNRIPRLALHQARLTRSAGALGWTTAKEIGSLLSGLPAQTLRLRLTMECQGGMQLEQAPLPQAKANWVVALAEARLKSADPWLGVKTTRRAVYDAARASLPGGVDEVIFLNERDEVCEGTITTVFFDRGEGMRTPPLTCGLLPGVLRAALAVPEEVLLARDLGKVQLWVGNSLRGLIRARFFCEKSEG